jgi:hypothetical protein
MDGPKAEKQHGDHAGGTGNQNFVPDYASKERERQRWSEYSTAGTGLDVFA